MSVGLALGWTSPIVKDLEKGSFHNITIDSTQMGWIGSLLTIGAITGSLPAGLLCDVIGRKRLLLILVIPIVAGWALLITAKNVSMMYLGRFCLGVALGACSVTAPLYITEVAHKDLRGAFGNFFQLMLSSGILLAYIVGYFFDGCIIGYTIVCAVVPLFFVVPFLCQPESPVYYVKKGFYEEARKALIRLRGKNCSLFYIDTELYILENAVKEARESAVSCAQTIKEKSNIKAFIISLMLMFFQQFSGINAFILYSSKLFAESQIKLDPKLATILTGTFLVFGTVLSIYVTEKLGRKFLLITSSLISAISVFALGIYFSLKDRHLIDADALKSLEFLPATTVCLFVLSFAFGLGPIPWMISSEIFGPEVKSLASALAGSFNWLMAFFITNYFLELEEAIGMDYLYFAFSGILFASVIFVVGLVPETKGKTVLEVQAALRN